MSDTYSSHFSDRNIPFGIASSPKHQKPQAATRFKDWVIFLDDCHAAGLFSGVKELPGRNMFSLDTLNTFAALPASARKGVRKVIQEVLRESHGHPESSKLPTGSYEPVNEVTMHLPVTVCDFVDFSCSLDHVKNAGRIIINDERPPPAFFNLPIGYQGRASSVVVSGTDIRRPAGQYRDKSAETQADGLKPVVYGPSKACDYEMEFAAVVGKPLPMNSPIKATKADEHIFGFVLLNDWSARDIQGFEMMPLGPLNGKNFGTTISPWIVTPEALEPFKTSGPEPRVSIPPYLQDPERQTYDIGMQVEIITGAGSSTVAGRSRLQSLYWSVRQMIAHVASAGSALRTGDIMSTGTVTGPGEDSMGCLLEVTEGGARPLKLKDGSERRFLQDEDKVRITAVAGDGDSGVGFGSCVGKLVASSSP